MTAPTDTPTRKTIDIGDEGPTVAVDKLERRDFVRYAGASGDFNPLHYDQPYAESAGHDDIFGQGMLVGGIASRVLTQWFGINSIRSFTIRFTGTVFPGDSVTATGTVQEIHRPKSEKTAKSMVTVELVIENQDSDIVATGDATAMVP